MAEGTTICPRCNETVDDLRFVPPDLLTRDLLADVKSSELDSTDEHGLEVCDDCFVDFESG